MIQRPGTRQIKSPLLSNEGARIGLNDPLCNVKTTEDLTSDGPHESFRTAAAQDYEERREKEFYSHVEHRNKTVPQQE